MIQLNEIKGVGNRTVHKLNELNIFSVFDLLSFFPTKYIDLKRPVSILESEIGQFSLYEGEIKNISELSFGKNKHFSLTLQDINSEKQIYFKCTFFNQPYLKNSFEISQKIRFLGKISNFNGSYELINPKYENIDNLKNFQGIYTIYPLKNIIGQNTFKKIISNAFDKLLNIELNGKYAEINALFLEKFQLVHNPNSIEIAYKTISDLASIDMGIALELYNKKQKYSIKHKKLLYNCDKNRVVDAISTIFEPTQSQLQAFNDIDKDLTNSISMSRIICGDVGSGKTLIAFYAMCQCCLSGYQSAMIVPTEILAVQHFENFKFLSKLLNINCALLTSKTSLMEKKQIYSKLQNGQIDCIFGTQSILNKDIIYKNLALAVIDEQHKFGVFDRAKIEEKGALDILSMTATPIPRSMALTFYKNLNISRIEKRENAKSNINTKLIYDDKLDEVVGKLIENSKKGNQAFIVCPSIVDSEGFDLYSIQSFIEKYKSKFEKLNVSVLYGKMKNEEKNSIMQDFKNKKTSILIATTVIEVGIDTLANNILILNADRFGLATLHQLRGRIGRDGRKSTCTLHTKTKNLNAIDRLKSVCKINDGQKLAEIDFDSRGPGEFLGTKQSGIAKTPIFNLQMTSEILYNAKKFSKKLEIYSQKELFALTRMTKTEIDKYYEKIVQTTLNS